MVSGTTATHGVDRTVALDDAGAQTTYILDKIAASVRALGGDPKDILRTRMYLRGEEDIEAAARAHGLRFTTNPPANTTFPRGEPDRRFPRGDRGRGSRQPQAGLTAATVQIPSRSRSL
jgi:enamine deaminase RidA (YjgF/YER057c/UK114 family)